MRLRQSVIDPSLQPIADKIDAGNVLSQADGQTLFASRDIHTIGRLADQVRRRLHGDRVYFNRNRHINYTNVCALSCKFCSFYRKRGEEGAYEMPPEAGHRYCPQSRRRGCDRGAHCRRAASVAEV